MVCGVISTTDRDDNQNKNIMNFGQLIKELRFAKELTLRQCCAELGVDPSNWSKMERGVTPPPKDTALLERWARFFGLAGERKQEFLDRACLARQEIPPDMANDEKVIAALPAFFRAVRSEELEGDRLKQFIEGLRAVYSSGHRFACEGRARCPHRADTSPVFDKLMRRRRRDTAPCQLSG